jgi:hypothetical protein
MPKKSKAEKSAKRAAKSEKMAAEAASSKADRAAVDKALNCADPFAAADPDCAFSLKVFRRCQKAAKGLDATLLYLRASQMSTELRDQCFQMLKTNMKKL